MASLQKLLQKIALKLDSAVCRYSKCKKGINIIVFNAYNPNKVSRPGASQKSLRGLAPMSNKTESSPARKQCSTRDVVITEFLSFSSALTRCVMNGLRMNPCLTISKIAVTLVKSTQIPTCSLGRIRTIKKIFWSPNARIETLFNKEYAPCENQREYAVAAKVLNRFFRNHKSKDGS